uniref:Ig-like domain-containing protein n=1 Tax=Chelydra serpentina TaxID=8475 RepID=A0A8C3XT86_CHESE
KMIWEFSPYVPSSPANLLSTAAFSQLKLVQSGPAMVKPSETLKLTCAVSGNSISSSNWWSWFRRTHGKGLEWMGLLVSNGHTVYAPSLQTRIAITRDTARNEYYLQVHSPAPEDTGMYYCARDIYLFGTVIETISNTGKETVPKPAICPPLHLLPPTRPHSASTRAGNRTQECVWGWVSIYLHALQSSYSFITVVSVQISNDIYIVINKSLTNMKVHSGK